MTADSDFEIFLVAIPGLEGPLCAEARAKGFKAKTVPGGVTLKGGWPEVWRANLEIRGASRVMARIGAFRALHLAQLDKRAREFPWGDVLRRDVPFRVEASCKGRASITRGRRRSASSGRSPRSWARPSSPRPRCACRARIEKDVCTISVDTSGELLHKRGHKQAVAKAPMRETMASLFLRQCGFDGSEPVVDPMCGSGTFVIEAAEIAAGLQPGRARHFAFEQLASFDAAAWQADARGACPRHAGGALLRQRPRRGGDPDEPRQRRARGRRRHHRVPGARHRGSRAAGRTARARHRQPAIRRPRRREGARQVALSRARAHAADEVRRLARGSDHE